MENEKIKRDMNALSKDKRLKILAVASGKGGVGKSTLTVNMALALQSRGYQVGIIDADLYGPSIRALLPEEQLPFQVGNQIHPAYSGGIQYISMALFQSEQKAASVRAPIANQLIAQFLEHVQWKEPDYLLIDFPPGTGDIQLTLAQKASIDGAVVVTTPQKIACLDVQKAMRLFESVQVPILGIVENMSCYAVDGEMYFPFGTGGAKDLSDRFGYPLLEQVPISSALNTLQDAGKNLFQDNQFKDEQKLFIRLSQRVEEELCLVQSSVAKHSSFRVNWRQF